MRVMYVCADRGIPVLGDKGASVHVRSLTGAMQRLGHDVTLVARRWEGCNPAPAVHRCEGLRKEPEHAVEQLRELIAEERPDAVIERYSLSSGPARMATELCGLQLTLEIDAPLAYEATRYRGLDDPGAPERERQVIRGADRLHVVSSSLRRYVHEIAPGTPVAWIPNGAEVAQLRAAPPARLPSLAGRTVVGFVGSMKEWHGVEQLLEAFASIRARQPQAALLLVGGGGAQREIVRRARREDLEGHVFCAGQVPHAAVPSLVGRFDIAAAPYMPVEDFYFHPLKIVEYLAAGKPVIYSDQGDLRELVGDAGLGYEPGSLEALVACLDELVGDRALRGTLAAAAAARADALDWETIAARVVRFAGGHPDDEGAGEHAGTRPSLDLTREAA